VVNIKEFLKTCVYYPCSNLSGLPVKFLGKRFQRFFYADYSVDREEFEKITREEGFKGYQLVTLEYLSPELVFGKRWGEIRRDHNGTFSQVHFEWHDPFIAYSLFRRQDGFGDDHGPETFELIFSRCEGVAAYMDAYSQRGIVPQCLVHIRSGLGFGGNFQKYPRMLRDALINNRGGLPKFMFYDDMGCNRSAGDYLDLVERYDMIEKWDCRYGQKLYLAKIS